LFDQVEAVYCAENLSDKLPDALVLVGRAAMQQMADWLEKLGMSEYALPRTGSMLRHSAI
jgi:hypothetical protein